MAITAARPRNHLCVHVGQIGVDGNGKYDYTLYTSF